MPSDALDRALRPRARRRSELDAEVASVLFRHPSGERAKRIKLGFAWDLFLFAGFFGVPLFVRGLTAWGAAILALWVVDLALGWLAHRTVFVAAQMVLFLAFFALQCWLGWRGNRMTARAYYAKGWRPTERRAPGIRDALARWRIEAD
jgi:hypothetical protein